MKLIDDVITAGFAALMGLMLYELIEWVRRRGSAALPGTRKPDAPTGYLHTCRDCGEIHNQPTCPMCGAPENRGADSEKRKQ